MKNIAILINASSDTAIDSFIKNHITNLPFNVSVFYGGYIPYRCSGVKENRVIKSYYRLYDFMTGSSSAKTNSYQKRQFKKCLRNKNIDLVLAEYLVTGGYVVDLCKKCNVPLIATALGYDISKYKVLEENQTRYKQLFDYAKAIIVVSEHMKLNLDKYGCQMSKVIYSPAGPADSFFQVLPEFDNQQFFALGRFVNKKAPHLTLLAFNKVLEKHPNASLVMGGDGPLMSVCKDLVLGLNLVNKVKFIGHISQEEQRGYLKNSIAFVQHSKVALDGDNEGTPVAILEASAAGLPIISTIHAGIPGVVINGKTGLLSEENDMQGMAQNMIDILDDLTIAKQMGEYGRSHVRENFTLTQHIETISEIVNR
jgi:colanic acid/amylovoran biosynthesis glycosyltransferase